MPQRRDGAQRDADHDGQQECHQPEVRGGADALGHDVVDGPVAVLVGGAQVTGEQATGPVQVLHRQRIVEPVLRVQLVDHAGWELLVARPRATRRRAHHGEGDD
jgi:hypothetical protein